MLQGWLPTPGLRVASDRPTGGAHGWLKSAAGRAAGSELCTRKPVVSKNTNELKDPRAGPAPSSSIIIVGSATSKGLATRLCFWTRRASGDPAKFLIGRGCSEPARDEPRRQR